MLPKTSEALWAQLKRAGNFEPDKAALSLLAFPEKIKAIRPRNIGDCLKNDTPTLATVAKYHGLAFAEETVSGLVFGAAEMLNVKGEITAAQVDFVAEHIADKYHYLTLADVVLCLKTGVSGGFGEVFGRVDVQVVCKWFERYEAARMDEAESRAYARHKEAVSGNPTDTGKMPDWFREFSENWQRQHPIPQAVTVAPAFEPDEAFLETITQEWEAKPESERVPFGQFKSLRIAQTRAAMMPKI